jgi:tetratricopeptide (TPR) repeat protein
MKTVLTILLLVFLWPLHAFSQEPSPEQKAKAKELYERAKIHYRSGELDKAAAEFKDSYEAYPKPETLFNLAQTHRLLKNHEKAIFYYKQYLSSADVGERDRQTTRDRISDLESLLKQQQKAQSAPPQGPEPPSVTAAQEPPSSTTARSIELTKAPSAAPPPKRVYQRWWFWTAVIGGAVLAGGAIGLGVGLSHQPQTPTAVTTNGTFHPF